MSCRVDTRAGGRECFPIARLTERKCSDGDLNQKRRNVLNLLDALINKLTISGTSQRPLSQTRRDARMHPQRRPSLRAHEFPIPIR